MIKLEKLIEEQQEENIVASEQTKKIQTEQCQELEQQIEIVRFLYTDAVHFSIYWC